jgi:hypothetical protein
MARTKFEITAARSRSSGPTKYRAGWVNDHWAALEAAESDDAQITWGETSTIGEGCVRENVIRNLAGKAARR